MTEVIQKDISLSTMVAAALIEGGTPAIEYMSIIIHHSPPNLPVKEGIIPKSKVAITKTTCYNSQEKPEHRRLKILCKPFAISKTI